MGDSVHDDLLDDITALRADLDRVTVERDALRADLAAAYTALRRYGPRCEEIVGRTGDRCDNPALFEDGSSARCEHHARQFSKMHNGLSTLPALRWAGALRRAHERGGP